MKPFIRPQPLLFALFLCLALAGRLTGDPLNRPSWWTDEASRVILPDAAENNLGAANIGQAKHMLTSALAALRPLLPEVSAQIEADLTSGAHPIVDLSVPELKTPAWIDQQKAPLLIGQLKAIAAPFYTRLHAADPAWLEAERLTNGTNHADSIFPWTPETSDDKNKAIATIGQLKAVFSLRFATFDPAHSLDSDDIGLFDVYANDTANERDDFIVLSPSGTRGRATNLNLLNLSAVDVVATVHLKNADGNVEFETSTALCPAGKMTKLRMWGRAVSSAVDQTTVLVDITANGRSLFTIEEAVTVYGEQTAFPSQPGPNDTPPNVIISPTSDSDEDGVPDLEEIASDHSPQSKLSFPPRWVSTDRYGWSPGTPNFIFARWMEPSGYAMEDDELTYLNQQLLNLNFPSAIPNIPNSGYTLNGNQGRIASAGYDADGNWGVIEHSCAWLETRPATRDLIRRTALKITRRYQDWDHEIECQVEPVEFTILPGATLSNRVDLIPELSHIQDGVVERLEQILLPVELISDLNNDGQITAADNPLRDAAMASGATDEIKDKGTEFIFHNDTLSNGIWDKEDTDPARPATEKDDDDAEEITIKPGITEGEVWLDHPAIAKLSFYKTRECKPADKVNLSPTSKFTVSASNPFPDKLFMRADIDGAPTYPEADPQFAGDLVLKIKVGTNGQEIEALKMKLTVVKQLGAKKYFHAARDYIMENNSRIFVRDKAYGSSTSFRVVSMLEELARMYPIDAARRTTGAPFKGIDQVNAAYDGSIHVVVNGNMNFFSDDRFNGEVGNIAAALKGLITDKCHGRLVRMNSYDAAVSSDNTSSTSSPEGSDLAGDTYGRYIAQYNQENKYSLAAGRVPLPSPSGGPSAAMGGLSTNYSNADRVNREYQLIGYSKCTDTNKGIVFTATQLTGTGSGPSLAEDAKKSGVAALPSGDADDLQILLLDGGTSTAMAHAKPDGSLSTRVKKEKHTGTLYYINTYLLFHCEKPRP